MNCPETQELLSAYYDDELTDDVRTRVSEHLDRCSECAKQLAEFEHLSALAVSCSTPTPPTHLWDQLEKHLDRQSTAQPARFAQGWLSPVSRRLVLAAAVLIATGVGWFAYQKWFVHDEHPSMTAVFGRYLEQFRHDPDAAQQVLLATYEGQIVDTDQAIRQVGYRPAVADGLPGGYTVRSTCVMKMPCCTCVQSLCQRKDGTKLAIFEHNDKETTQWFGDRPKITARCDDTECCLVEMGDQIAASWKRGARHITVVGARDIGEVDRIVAWMDRKKEATSN